MRGLGAGLLASRACWTCMDWMLGLRDREITNDLYVCVLNERLCDVPPTGSGSLETPG